MLSSGDAEGLSGVSSPRGPSEKRKNNIKQLQQQAQIGQSMGYHFYCLFIK